MQQVGPRNNEAKKHENTNHQSENKKGDRKLEHADFLWLQSLDCLKEVLQGPIPCSANPMKTSFYNLFFEVEGKLVLFNTFRANLIEVTDELKTALEQEDIAKIPADLISELAELGFLTEDNEDETSQYLERYENSKERGGQLWVKLFMATSCNLGCPYCYQAAPAKPGNVIQKEQIDRLIKWCDWECEHNGVKGLQIELYGGEPLLARLQTPRLISGISEVGARHEVPVGFSIITNATLLDDALIDTFIQNNVYLQVTLDGDSEQHDKRRAWKTTGKGTFDEIFTNLEKICNRGGAELIRIRMNVDQDNVGGVKSVAERVHALGIKSFHCGRIHFREKNTEYSGKMISSKEFEENFDLKMFRILQPLGFADSPSKLESHDTCLFHWKRGFSVSPSLGLFKCDELIDFPEYCVGQIDNNGVPEMRAEEYRKSVSRKPTDFEHCSTCRYLPQCGSGCAIKALNAKGTPHTNFCEATYDSVRRRLHAYIRAEEEGLLVERSTESSCASCHCAN